MTWMFAYDTLIGEHELREYGAQPARLRGHHRSFNHASTLLWGRPEQPCPTVGLSPGDECWGLAFKVPWGQRRKMKLRLRPTERFEEYTEARLAVELADGGTAKARVWLSAAGFADGRRWSASDLGPETFVAAHGTAGRGVEYVRTLAHALQLWRLRDPLIDDLWVRMDAWRPT